MLTATQEDSTWIGRLEFYLNLEYTEMVVCWFTGFWRTNLSLIAINRFGKGLRLPGEVV